MPNEPADSSESVRETPVDRFEHEIQDLEQPLGHSVRQWLVGLGAAGALLGAFFLGAWLQQMKTDPAVKKITTIDTLEPKRAPLSEKPTIFRWESISGASSYVLRIQEQGEETDLIARETKNNWLELTQEEQARLVRGGRYAWSVRARSSEGWPIGQGDSSFSLGS